MLSIVLAILVCFVVAIAAAGAGVLRRRYGDRHADVVSGVIIFLVLGYVSAGVCVAVVMAFNPVVQHPDIEYDSREFLR